MSAKEKLRQRIRDVTSRDGLSASVERLEDNSRGLLSFAQRRLWFLQQLLGANAVYNLPLVLGLSGELDTHALIRSLEEIVRRHDVLRARFRPEGTEAIQVIEEQNLNIAVELVYSAESLKAICQHESNYAFDLAQGNLCRIRLLQDLSKVNCRDRFVLVVTMHHGVSDGWSVGVFLKELVALYRAFKEGEESPLAPLPIQYLDYAHWQRQGLKGRDLARQRSYWCRQLDGLPPLLTLPTDYPRPPQQTYRGRSIPVNLPKRLSRQLNSFCRQQELTLFVTLLSAFAVLLARYSGQDDVAIGTPVANREKTETRDLIGFFVNNLVLRCAPAGSASFVDFLQSVKKVALDAWSHQDLPFETLVEKLNPQRSLGHSPLFQVMFALQNVPMSPLSLPGLELSTDVLDERSGQNDRGIARFDLNLNLRETPEGIAGVIEFSTDLFDVGSIARMFEHYERILQAMVASPYARISTIDFLSHDEKNELIHDWNDTHAPIPELACLHQLFEVQETENADAVALVYESTLLSYGELNRRANQLAHCLLAAGAGVDSRVGIFVERSPDLLIGLLGILKAGACYVPLDPQHPPRRLAYVIADSGLRVMVIQERLYDSVEFNNLSSERADTGDGDFRQSIQCLAIDGASVGQNRVDNPRVDLCADNLAYVIYTSGSTGQPKGVSLSHRNAVNFLCSMREKPGLDQRDRMLAVTTLSFDIALLELFLPLTTGACVDIAASDRVSSGALLAERVIDNQITVMQATPVTWKLMLEAGWQSRSGFKALVGGDAFPRELAKALLSRVGSLWNMYGPTETSVWSAVHSIDSVTGPVPIGRPIDNTELYVLDGEHLLCPVGVPGELFIGGAGLARGYFNRAALTAERFVPHPFSRTAGQRLYATGDLVRYLRAAANEPAVLECIGRIDHQVKVRGFRIELGEIESVLRRHEQVREAVALVCEDKAGDKRIVAYIVPPADFVMDDPALIQALRSHTQNELPAYMLPAAFVVLQSLPMTANGKVDRKSLPAPDITSQQQSFVAPEGPTECLLATLWAEVLGLERVGRFDNFFELGGHSLLATQLLGKISEVFSVDIPMHDIFEQQSLQSLAVQIQRTEQGGRIDKPPLERVSREQPLLLSHAQQRLWFLGSYMGPSAVYNIPLALELSGDVNAEALLNSLQAIVARHDVLRTRFVEAAHGVQQAVDAHFALLRLEAVGSRDELRAVYFAERTYPFDLARDVLCRIRVLSIADEGSYALLVTMHHSISDAWSMGLFFQELLELYEAEINNRAANLATLRIQYADYAQWQREYLQGDVAASQLSFWREQLDSLPSLLNLPTDRRRPQQQSFRGGIEFITLSPGLSARLQAMSREQGVTLYMTLLSAFALLMSRYSGQKDIAIGTPIANRTSPETGKLIGFFVNTLVMPFRLGDDPAFTTLLKRTRETALQAYAHQDIPFEQLVDDLRPERSLSHTPLFQVMFALQNVPLASARVRDMEVSPLHIVANAGDKQEEGASRFDLTLNLHESATGIAGTIEYSSDLFEHATIVRMLAHFQQLLQGIAAAPEKRVSQFSLSSEAEQRRLLSARGPAIDYADNYCVHALIENRAAEKRDAPAFLDQRQRCSYAELIQHADRIAAELIARSINAGSVVAILVDRIPRLMAAILGTMKAGASCLVLDRSVPVLRSEWQIEQSEAGLLLVDTDRPAAENVSKFIVPSIDLASVFERNRVDIGNTVSVTASSIAWLISSRTAYSRPHILGFSHRNLCSLVASDNLEQSTEQSIVDASLQFPDIDAANRTALTILAALIRGEENIPVAQILEAACRQSSNRAPLSMLQNLGRPGANTGAYLLDSNLDLLPQGLRGELFIDNGAIAQGFVGQGADSADHFLPNPFSLEAGSRLFRCGVQARMRVDGSIEYRGKRIANDPQQDSPDSLKTLRHHLEDWDAVQEVALIERDSESATRLYCYIVPTAKSSINAQAALPEVRTWLKKHKERLRLPDHCLLLDSIPKNDRGQIDWQSLPANECSGQRNRFGEPQGPTEELLAALWCDVLKIETVSRGDDFFELGGHSLLTAQLVSRIRENFAVELSIRQLFEAQTLQAQAETIGLAKRGEDYQYLPIARIPRDDPLPLSYAQQRLWFLDKYMGPNSVYNMPLPLRLNGVVNITAMVRSLEEILRRHESLRTHFEVRDGVAVQVIDPPVLKLKLESVSDDGKLAEVARSERNRPFDLSCDQHCRIRLLHNQADDSYALLVTMHHLASDAWSLVIFLQELVALYQAFDKNEASPLAPLPIQYADFANWQRQWLQGEILEKELAYWREQLSGLPPLLTLPTDRPRPLEQTFRGSYKRIKIEPSLSGRIRDLCRDQGVTLYMTLLAAFAVLLSRYSGQTDLAIGTPMANRSRRETEGLIGFFVNNLIMRTDLSADPTFIDLLARTREVALQGYAHQEVPFEQLVEKLSPKRSLSYSAFFQVTFTLQNVPVGSAALPDLQIEPLTFAGGQQTEHDEADGVSRFDLSLSLQDTPNGLDGRMEYNCDLFEGGTIRRMLDHYTALLTAIADTPEARVSNLGFLTTGERRRQLQEYNATRADYPRQYCIHEMFEAVAAKHPDAVAVVCGSQALSYGELDRRANQLAHFLRARAIGCETCVGVCVERSLAMMVALFGILKAGASYVPLDPEHPPKRLETVIRNSGIDLLLTQFSQPSGSLAREIVAARSTDRPLQYFDLDDGGHFATLPTSKPEFAISPANLAYVMYTSGSTGEPKGVTIQHESVVNFIDWMQKRFQLEPCDNVLQKTPYGFDISVSELFWPLAAGATLVMARPGGHREPRYLQAEIRDRQISVLHFVPPMLNAFLSVTEWQQCQSIRLVMCGGEALSCEVQKRFFARAPFTALENLYGPTEATVDASHWRCHADSELSCVPIGKPLQNISFFIVDGNWQLVPGRCMGELLIGGVALSRGYINRPGLSADRFIPDPFTEQPGGRLYRTGDVVRYLNDGNIEFIGRIDRQIKVRGFRIELAEIEQVLLQHHGVSETVVLLREDKDGQEMLVAYVVCELNADRPDNEAEPNGNERPEVSSLIRDLRTHAQAHLPDYMIPAAIVVLDAMPLTANGKVNRKALPVPESGADKLEYVVPEGPTEEGLARLWCEALKLERVGRFDDFFALGGHSLLAVQLLSAIHTRFETDIPLRVFFENPSIAQTAKLIDFIGLEQERTREFPESADSIEI